MNLDYLWGGFAVALATQNLLIGLDAQVRKVVVNDLRDDTFYAVIWLDKDGNSISIDSRLARSNSRWHRRRASGGCRSPRQSVLRLALSPLNRPEFPWFSPGVAQMSRRHLGQFGGFRANCCTNVAPGRVLR